MKRALAWLDGHPGDKRFVWIHLYEPHYPYLPPEPFRSEYAGSPYHGEVAYTDVLLQPVFERFRKEGRDATVVVTSDHGESLGEHGELTHGVFAYNATLKVPLLIWSPSRVKPGRIETLARHVDLLPTVLEMNNLPPPEGISGRSLFDPDFREEPSYFESLSTYLNRGWAPLRGCIDQGYKAIDLPTPELYQLAEDPSEQHNLALDDPETARAFMVCLPEEPGLGTSRNTLSSEEIESLQALGYVAASPGEDTDVSGKDPKSLMETDRKFHTALARFGSGDHQGAIRDLESIIREQPQMAVAYLYLSDFYDRLKQVDKAIQTMERALRNGVRTEGAVRKLAMYLTGAGQAAKALALLKSYGDSNDPETHSAFGKTYTQLNQYDKAEASFEKSLALDPSNAQVLADWGTLYLIAQQPARAKPLFEKALAQNEFNADAWNGLGVVFATQGRADQAVRAWENAVKHNPELAFCHWNLASYYEKNGQKDLALKHYQAYVGLTTGANRQKGLDRIEKLEERR